MHRSKLFSFAVERGRTAVREVTVFQNFPTVISRTLFHSTPIECKFRNGGKMTLSDSVQVYHVSRYALKGWRYNPDTDTVEIPETPSRRKLVFEGAGREGDLIGVFGGEYSELDVQGRVVLDIGASIGDSALYFATQGAKLVHALEPFPIPYERACRNVERNGLTDVVRPHQIVCSGTSGTQFIDPNRVGTIRTAAKQCPGGIPVPSRTLADLVRILEIPEGSVLKVDCEGGEYSIFRMCNHETLLKFDQVQIEYHYGVKDLVGIFAAAGYAVQATGPRFSVSTLKEPAMEAGMIKARHVPIQEPERHSSGN